MKYQVFFIDKQGVIRDQCKDRSLASALDKAILALAMSSMSTDVVQIDDQETRKTIYLLWLAKDGTVGIKFGE